MTEELVKIGNTELKQGGVGLDFDSKLFKLKPATLTINQGMTQVEGAVPGNLRIVETGDEFKKMTVAMLIMPKESRSYYIGSGVQGELKRIPENLMCFSQDLIKPDDRAKQPQAITCGSCEHANWNNDVSPAKPPECDKFYYVVMIDTETQTPIKMYIRGTSKKPFEAAMQNLARTFKLLQAKGEKPNIFDISFEISTEKYKTKAGQITYILKVDGKSFHKVTPEEAAEFGELYLNYVNYGKDTVAEETDAPIIEADKAVNAAVGNGEEITV